MRNAATILAISLFLISACTVREETGEQKKIKVYNTEGEVIHEYEEPVKRSLTAGEVAAATAVGIALFPACVVTLLILCPP